MSDIPAFPQPAGAVSDIPAFPGGGKDSAPPVGSDEAYNAYVAKFRSSPEEEARANAREKAKGESLLDFDKVFNNSASRSLGLNAGQAKNIVSGVDFIGSIPAMVLGVGEDLLTRTGHDQSTHAEQSAAGNRSFDAIMNVAGSPFHKLLQWAGIGSSSDDESNIDKMMGKADALLAQGGDAVEKKTGGLLNADDVKTIVHAAMAAGGAKGMKGGLTKLAARMPDITLDALKKTPEAERAQALQTVQASKEPQAAAEFAEQGVEVAERAAVAKTRITDPQSLVFDPVKGELSEAIPEMGKELPKQTTEEQALDKLVAGKRFDLTAEERIALKGFMDRPLEKSIVDESGKVVDLEAAKKTRLGKDNQGFIEPELLARLAAMGFGASAGLYFSDDKDFMSAVVGGSLALAATMIPVRKVVDTFKTMAKEDSRLKINELADAHEKYTKMAAVEVWSLQKQVEDLVPKAEDRNAITHALEANNVEKLTKNQVKATKIVRDYFTGIGEVASLEGILTSARENYVTHLWDWSENKGLFDKWMERGSGSPGMGVGNRFAKERSIPTIAEGKAAGLKPLTEDISTIMGIYGNSMSRSIANSVFTKALKLEKVPGTTLGLVVKADDAPHSYVSLNNPALQGLKVHPDIAPSLKMLYDTSSPGTAMKIMQGISDTSKRVAVSFSLFHAKALTDAMIGGSSNPFKAVTRLPGFVMGTDKYLKELRKGSASPLVERAAEGGLKFSLEGEGAGTEDAGVGFYGTMSAVQGVLDKTLPGAGLPVKGVIALNHAVDNIMWARLHAGMKLNMFAEKYQQLLDNSGKKGTPIDPDKAARIAASYTNDLFGGLNWRRVAEDASTRFGRELGQATLNPGARRVLGILAFAPDWTISTTRAAIQAFGKPDFLRPTTLAGLHQQYLIRSAAYYLIVGDAINYQMSGHHVWENKDPTVLDMDPKGERHMQWSKHTMEPVHWMTKPAQQAINKLGILPREAIEQALDVEYLSAKGRMPPMESRLKHIAKDFAPISAQQADQGGAASVVSGFAGVPIYGKTSEQKKKDKEERAKRKKGKT